MQFEFLLTPAPPKVRVAPDVRCAEHLAFAQLDTWRAEAKADPTKLRRPARVVVPSASLRRHVSAAYMRHVGHAVVGIEVQTLYGLAAELVDRGGASVAPPLSLSSLIGQRLARRHPVLERLLGPLQDGYLVAARAVRDLMAAGLTDAHLAAVTELLASDTPTHDRSQAIIDVAAATHRLLSEFTVRDASTVYERASDAVSRGGLSSRATLLYGFTETSGVEADFIATLLASADHDTTLLVANAPRPKGLVGPVLTPPLRSGSQGRPRLAAAHGSGARNEGAPSSPPRLTLHEASTSVAEVRAVATQLQAAIDAGVAPEQLGVVVGQMDAYRVTLRTQFARLGVPWSGIGEAAPRHGASRRVEALLTLLRDGADTPLERWLELVHIDRLATPSEPPLEATTQPTQDAPSAWRMTLRLGLRSLGVARLGALARLKTPSRDVRLPLREGFEGGRATSRTLPRARVIAAKAAVADLMDRFAAWPEQASLAEHTSAILDVVYRALGHPPGDPTHARDGLAPVLATLATIQEHPDAAGLTLSRDEAVSLVATMVADTTKLPLGGAGGGVQVLTLAEAQGRTFERLFVVGANRGELPAGRGEDPLLPNPLRRRLRELLPDLATHATAAEAARYGFYALLGAAPDIQVSWRRHDTRGRALSPSPLVEQLALSQPAAASPSGSADAEGVASLPLLMTAHEHAIAAALGASRSDLARVWAVALDDASLGATRRRILDEVDPDLSTIPGRARAAALGPYDGFLGHLDHSVPDDPRRQALWVTTLERFAACPWQTALERLLRVEAVPDPLETLPQLDARLQGQAIHAFLEALVKRAGGTADATLAELVAQDPVSVSWPSEADAAALRASVSLGVLEDAGIALPGLAHILAEQIAPFLAMARSQDWASLPPEVLAAEVDGTALVVDLEGRDRPIAFRADRLDAPDPDGGALILTDYKRGRGPHLGKRPATQREKLLERVRSGVMLQGPAYVKALGPNTRGAGRYLYLTPDPRDRPVEVRIDAGDRELMQTFESTVRGLVHGWDHGVFFPRLEVADRALEPYACRWCRVAESCVRGDSGARRRLVGWQAARRDGALASTLAPADKAALDVWFIASRTFRAPAVVTEDHDPWSGGG